MESSGQIFLIEDEFIINSLVAYALRQLGYDVKMAYTGGEALTQLSEAKLDQVALDMELPGLDGQDMRTLYTPKALLSKVILNCGKEAYFLNNPQATPSLKTPSYVHRLEEAVSSW